MAEHSLNTIAKEQAKVIEFKEKHPDQFKDRLSGMAPDDGKRCVHDVR